MAFRASDDSQSQCPPGKTKKGGGTLPDVVTKPGLHRMLAQLIKLGAGVNTVDDNGMTPLHHAALAKDLPTLQELVALGADVTVADNAGKTVLHYLAGSGSTVLPTTFIKPNKQPKIITEAAVPVLQPIPPTPCCCSLEEEATRSLPSEILAKEDPEAGKDGADVETQDVTPEEEPAEKEEDFYEKGIEEAVQTSSREDIEELMDESICDDMAQLRDWISYQLGEGPKNGSIGVRLGVDLRELSDFINDQYPTIRDVRKVLTVTGSSEDAYANYAERYVMAMWGETKIAVLEWILPLADAKIGPEFALDLKCGDVSLKGFKIGDLHSINIRGSLQETVDIVMQIAWIVSALRSPYTDREDHEAQPVPALSRATMSYRGLQALDAPVEDPEGDGDVCRHEFRISLQALWPVTADGATNCWNRLFPMSVIASGFRIPPRVNSLRGLELPVGLMVELARLDYSLPFLNSFVLKGRTTAVIPRFDDHSLRKDQRCVQWHLIQSNGRSSLSMESVVKQLGTLEVLPIEYSDAESTPDDDSNTESTGKAPESSFQSAVEAIISESNRHFLGLYLSAVIHLGTSEARVADIRPSSEHLRTPSSRVVWNRSVNTGVSAGIPPIPVGISISTGWIFDNNGRNAQSTDEAPPLETMISEACARVAVLYVPTRKTAWMVPESCVILHLIKARSEKPSFGSKPPGFPHDWEMRPTNLETAVRNFVNQCSSNGDWFKTFEKMFRQMKEAIIRSRTGAPLRFHSASSERLSGVDFDRIARLPRTWSLKEVAIDRHNSGGWTQMVRGIRTEEVHEDDILVFFCTGLQDPIRPIDPPGTCGTWTRVPPMLDYLVMTVSAFEELKRRQGDRAKLSRKHFWVQGDQPPFYCSSWHCNRLQKLTTARPLREQVLMDHAEEGALVFGVTFNATGRCTNVTEAPSERS
ncbi:hypothetical protein B0I37DRAFT_405476 [Chaetomium sp. MPI-CAGE-AT-0009]|nr:hypothetical protein B0I37DRAFT_405476 [Chaetomium sp. MPI-CAGE-AT-0009]